MPDDPIDAFDKIADDIKRAADELAAADELRSATTEQRKRKPDDASDATPESVKPPK